MDATMPRMTARALLGCALLSLGGCLDERMAGSTGVGNPPQSQAVFAMVAGQGPGSGAAPAAKATAPALPVATSGIAGDFAGADTAFVLTDLGGTRFTLRSALANVGLVRFKLPDGLRCAHAVGQDCEEDAIRIRGPFVADLMTGSFSPAFPAFSAPRGSYRRVDVRLEALEGGSAPDSSLIGHSMILSGTFSYGGRSDREFRIVLDFNEEARFDSGTMEVRDQALNRLLLRLDVDAWLARTDITRCLDEGVLSLDVAGGLRIGKDNACEGLEDSIKAGIKASGDLEEGRGQPGED